MSGGDGNGGRGGLFFAVKKLLHHRSFFRSRGENHLSTSSPRKNSSPSSSIQRGTFSPSQTSLLSEESLPRNAGNELRFDIERISLRSSEDGLPNSVSSADEDSQQGHNQTIFASPVSSFTPCVTRNSSISSGSFQGEGSSPSHPHLCDGELFPTIAGNEQGFSDDIMSVKSSEGALGNSDSHFSMFSLMSNVSSADEDSQQGHNQTITASPASSCPPFVSKNGSISSGALQGEGSRPCYGEFLPIISGNAQGFNTERMLLKRFEDGLAILVNQFSTFPLMNHMSPANENSQQGLNQTTTASPASSCSPRVSRTSSISFGALVNNVSSAAEDSQQGHNQTTSASPDSSCALHVSRNSSISSSAYQGEGSSLSRPHSCSGEFLPIVACNELWFDDEIVSLESSQDRYKSMSSHYKKNRDSRHSVATEIIRRRPKCLPPSTQPLPNTISAFAVDPASPSSPTVAVYQFAGSPTAVASCSFTANDDDSSSTTTELMSIISPNWRFIRIITGWQKGQLLGRGSFGSVFEGIADGGFFFAVKEVSLLDQGDDARQSIYQLEQEIALLSQFEHDNIVQYFGTDKDDSKLYIFLELVSQGSLLSLYQKYHLRDSQVSAYTRQILLGLKYLHDRDVVHRDIKCANILVDAAGSVKLADFGLAKATKLNDVKSCKGTAFWMAPEVVNRRNSGYGLAADIWSLGCTVLEMLTRQFPYCHLEHIQALFKIGRGEPPHVPNTLSGDAQDFIRSCLQVDPNARPTASQLLDHPFVKHPLPSPLSSPSPRYLGMRF